MYGLYLSAAGAQAYNDYMEVLSNNIANVDTPGFRREFAVLKARPAEEFIRGADSLGSGTINNVGGGVALYETRTDFSPGLLQQTGNSTDLAISDSDGDVFFAVRKDGEEFLTRAGNFHLDQDGSLVTADGYEVLSDEGTPVQVDPNYPVHISDEGNVIQTELGVNTPLALRRPQSLGDLVKAGGGRFASLSEVSDVPAGERSVRQGYLEHSSSRPIQEMMQLIQISRGYEANIRMIQHQDSTTSSLINRVLSQA